MSPWRVPPLLLACVLASLGCDERPSQEQLRALAPKPLPTLRSAPDAGTTTAPLFGAALPSGIPRFGFDGEKLSVDGREVSVEAFAEKLRAGRTERVALDVPGDVLFAQLAPVLAQLEDAGTELWLPSPHDRSLAFPVQPWDEPRFRAWLDEPVPGKIRVIQRADGFELSTNLGKLLGPDRSGPSLPTRAGRFDLDGMREGLRLLQQRFPEARDACLVPSFAVEVRQITLALSGFFHAPGGASFAPICLVYPRPAGHH